MDHIEHPSAYRAAIERNIAANRRIGGAKRWFAAHADAPRLRDWLTSQGEFASNDIYDANGDFVRTEHHPVSTAGSSSAFIIDMRAALWEWGGLTDAQTAAVRRSLAQAEERVANRAQRKAEQHAADLNSQHLGTVGERIVLTLTVRHVVVLEGIYGTSYINICNDAAGNVVVYKGTNRFDEAIVTSEGVHTRRKQVTVKATVKAHGERDGVAQTIIARPKIQD